jgi:hypothetical protein
MRLYLAGSTCTWVALSFLEVPDYTLFRLAGDETAGGGEEETTAWSKLPRASRGY